MNLPDLPEPFGFAEPTARSPAFHFMRRTNETGTPLYTADQMRAFYAEGFRAGMERAKQIAEGRCVPDGAMDCAPLLNVAAAIKAEIPVNGK